MKRTDIRRILIIGAGPIVIGQACEFDYSGSQACRSLMAEGYEVILVNSNPATIMTDPNLATATYIEPITAEAVEKIIAKERPDAMLPTMGGQTALNIAHQLHQNGVLGRYNVKLIGANFAAIHTAEDRDEFKKVVASLGLESLHSETVTNLDEAWQVAKQLGFPLIIRPAFTLGGSGGSVVEREEEFEELVRHGLFLSPISQVLLEESALGWKEYEFEVMRDARDNVVIVCSVENVDPMGVHTGDSITVAPAQTLTDKEYHTLRNASIDIIRKVGVDAGGCNIQFAVHPKTGRVVVIEMNPRVSRSSALVSKATGVPIAKISAKLAVGYTLDEIMNDITRTTPACFEPAIDYVVTKIPRFSFEKFPGSTPTLSPQMKSVGEVMAIGSTFQESFQKALRGLEIGLSGFYFAKEPIATAALKDELTHFTVSRLRRIYQALHQNISVEEISQLTGFDPWFLANFKELVILEKALSQYTTASAIPSALLRKLKTKGFSDTQIGLITGESPKKIEQQRQQEKIESCYKAVDTCAGEFVAETPYFYGTYDASETEARVSSNTKKVVIIGGGPNRIGQGIEFDYCCVHAAFSLQKLGYEAVMINSNPETVSTDYDISNRLYFEPLTPEDVYNILQVEQPLGIITQLGGQTPLKLSQALKEYPEVSILGTSADSIDLAEDRERFGTLLDSLGLKAPEAGIGRSEDEVLSVAQRIGYPLMVRPSYVLGGQAMRIFYNEENLVHYLQTVVQAEPAHPVLVDRFLEEALEVDVDALCDGETVFMGAILEHVEYAGIHSGDSVCVYPTQTIAPAMIAQIETATEKLALALNVKGLLNIQFALYQNELYVLEVNPRASRTVPFVCKATGYNLIDLAVKIMLGEKLSQIAPAKHVPKHIAVKAPVFPFVKFKDTDPQLGPEMRSTGEVMGCDTTFAMAFAKAQMGAGVKFPTEGCVFISVNNHDKPKALNIAKRFSDLGFSIVATGGTALFLKENGVDTSTIDKKYEGPNNAEQLIQEGKIQLVINTPAGEAALTDDSYIRKAAVIHNIPMTTTMRGAEAYVQAIQSLSSQSISVNSLQQLLA